MEEKEKDKKDFWFKLFAGGIFIFSWLVLIGIRLSSDISLKVPLIITIVLTVISIVLFFGKQIYHLKDKLKQKEQEQKVITKQEIAEILKNEIEGKDEEGEYGISNYIEPRVPIIRKPHNINNSIIYEHHLKLYRPIELRKEVTDKIIVLINATSPELQPAILPSDCDKDELEKAINDLSRNPYNPDTEETELSTDRFGQAIQKTKKVSYSKKSEEKEGDVV